MEYDDLLKMYQQYTMENQGILGFFESLKETYPDPKKGRWFVPGSKHYSCDKV